MQTKTINIAGSSDGDSYIQLTTVQVELPKHYTFADLKTAIKKIDNFVASEVEIGRPNSLYDCTGQHFTMSIKRIYKSIFYKTVTFTYEHWICVDV